MRYHLRRNDEGRVIWAFIEDENGEFYKHWKMNACCVIPEEIGMAITANYETGCWWIVEFDDRESQSI